MGVDVKRFVSLACVSAVAASIGATVIADGAAAASPLPTLKIALKSATGVSVSGSEVSGAVNVAVTFHGSVPRGSNGPSFALVRLNQGATLQQVLAATKSGHGDINAITPYASLLVSGGPGTTQTKLSPGNWVALNVTSNGQPAIAPFTVKQSSTPAVLPTPGATETAFEFGFHGPVTLHRGTILREANQGWLVHMVQFIGVKSKAAGEEAMLLMKNGHDNRAGQYFLHSAFGMGPVTHGGMQQQTVTAPAGYYIEACFMDTQDHREHTQLGMLRLIKVVK